MSFEAGFKPPSAESPDQRRAELQKNTPEFHGPLEQQMYELSEFVSRHSHADSRIRDEAGQIRSRMENAEEGIRQLENLVTVLRAIIGHDTSWDEYRNERFLDVPNDILWSDADLQRFMDAEEDEADGERTIGVLAALKKLEQSLQNARQDWDGPAQE